MERAQRQEDFMRFRKEFPFMEYVSFSMMDNEKGLSLKWHFNLSDKYHFYPELFIPSRPFYSGNIDKKQLENIAFHIGMIELISYWKAACPPKIKILCANIQEEQKQWWKKLYFHGLGEFFFVNGIQTSFGDFVHIESHGPEYQSQTIKSDKNSILLAIGGGKDSVVSLKTLQNSNKEIIPLLLNPNKAALDCINEAGYHLNDCALLQRKLDPGLIKLNGLDFLNGHTPFSALLAFTSLLPSYLSKSGDIVLSNENSANEASVPGTKINHQYSKSYEFESDFRWYYSKYINSAYNYFSFLRPLNEIQIVERFSKFSEFHSVFRSCNVGSKTNVWCGKCPKCLFTAIMLSPFAGNEQIISIFGKNILDDEELIPTLEELTGKRAVKPFECVGTRKEVIAALNSFITNHKNEELPALLKHYLNTRSETEKKYDLKELLKEKHHDHFLTPEYQKILKDK